MGRKRKLNLLAYSLTLLFVIGGFYLFGDEATRHSLVLGAVAGSVGILLCTVALNSLRYMLRFSRPSVQPDARPLQPTQVSSSWIRSGRPVFSFVPYSASPDMHTGETGIWRCEGPGTFDWHFGVCDEVAYILSGEVDVEYLGRRFTLKAGDSVTFFAGTKTTWHVAEHVQKSYVLYLPNLPVRWYRRLFTSLLSRPSVSRSAPLRAPSNP